MRVLSIVHWLNRGGIEIQLMQALPYLHSAGIQMDICCTGPPGSLDAEFKSLGCTIHRVAKSANCYRTARVLSRLLETHQYDVVHSNLGYASGGFVLGARRSETPCVVSLHSPVPLSLLAWSRFPVSRQVRALWLRWHRSLIDRYATVVVGHSESNIRAFCPSFRASPHRFRVLSNGIAFPNTLPTREHARASIGVSPDATVLLHVGTFKPEKNHAALIRIFTHPYLFLEKPWLVLVGDGPLRHDILRRCAKAGVLERIVLAGTQEDVWPYYRSADVFVFPSIVEGFGNALVESQGAAVPVVASDIPAHREAVAPSQHRFLFPVNNSATAALHVCEQLRASRENANPWVAQSLQYVRSRFSVQRFAEDLGSLYRSVHNAELDSRRR